MQGHASNHGCDVGSLFNYLYFENFVLKDNIVCTFFESLFDTKLCIKEFTI